MVTRVPKVVIEDLGLIPYQQAWDYQTQVHQQLVQQKRANRDLPPDKVIIQQHRLIFCEHHPVYTLGKSGSMSNLLVSEETLQKKGIDFFKINRGGDITFHGPGQVVGYPILDLDEFFTDVHQYVRFIEQAIIDTLTEYGLEGMRVPGYTGVWLEKSAERRRRKICAIGVHLSRWVTLHGFAFNVNTDLSFFRQIIPCGISAEELEVTSLEEELNRKVDTKKIKKQLTSHFARIFQFELSSIAGSQTR